MYCVLVAEQLSVYERTLWWLFAEVASSGLQCAPVCAAAAKPVAAKASTATASKLTAATALAAPADATRLHS